jgi:tetratricopeptide (TPR) repeat protein
MAAYAAHFDPRFRRYATISQPTGYEAYRELQTGITVRRGESEGTVDSAQLATAVAHFRRAIALEPEFMAPRIQVASIYALIGECRVTDSVAASIRATGARLLTTDQATIDHLMAGCQQDPRGRYVAAQQLFRDAPEMAENVFALAQAALMYNKPSESLSCMERLERTHDPEKFRSWCWNVMTHAHHQLGQYREALRLAERIRATDPDHWFIDRYEMRQWAALGDTARVNQQIERSLARRDQAVEAGDDMLWIGEELRGHGHRAAGRALCARGVAWFAARPSSQRATGQAKWSVAKLLYCAEQWDEARAAYALLAAADSSGSDAIRVRTRLGALAARRGDSAEMTRIDQWLAARDSLPLASYGRAVLAAFLGDQARAFTLFQFAWERNQPNFIEAHTDPALEPLRDYPPVRALLEAAR